MAREDAVAGCPTPDNASAVIIPVENVAATRSPPTNRFVNSTPRTVVATTYCRGIMTPTHRAVADALYARDACSQALGIEIVTVADGSCVARMHVRTDMCNGFGIAHGGMTFLLADTAMAFASNAENEVALASSAEIDWLAPVRDGDVMTATAARRWSSGRSTVWDITITDGSGETVAIARGRTRTVGRPVIG
jgi:acyl-CoA thioesterase